jgi:hypothetical protein
MSKNLNQRKFCVGMNIVFFLLRMNSYDQTISGSLEPTEKNENRPKFETTMKFVEDYLKTVVEQPNSFSDREQNKLTHEVIFIIRKKIFYLLFVSSRLLI